MEAFSRLSPTEINTEEHKNVYVEPKNNRKYLTDAINKKYTSGDNFISLEIWPTSGEFRKPDIGADVLFYSIVWNGRKLLTDFGSNYNNSSNDEQFLRVHTVFELAQTLNDSGETVLMHLTCVGTNNEKLVLITNELKRIGVFNILALQGDGEVTDPNFKYATDLIGALLRKWKWLPNLTENEVTTTQNNLEHNIRFFGPQEKSNLGENNILFSIGVAGYPEIYRGSTAQHDVHILKLKEEAGARFIITQFCIDVSHLINFVKNCHESDVHMAILPGILCSTSYEQFKNMCKLCGVQIPTLLKNNYYLKSNQIAFQNYNVYHTTMFIKAILIFKFGRCTYDCCSFNGRILGVQFFTLNKFDMARKICKNLGFCKQEIEFPL